MVARADRNITRREVGIRQFEVRVKWTTKMISLLSQGRETREEKVGLGGGGGAGRRRR